VEHFGWQEFQTYSPMDSGVLGFEHHTHTTSAEFLKDAVVRNGLPDERVGACHSAAILGCGQETSQRRGPWQPNLQVKFLSDSEENSLSD
jgi:hypothetical protein